MKKRAVPMRADLSNALLEEHGGTRDLRWSLAVVLGVPDVQKKHECGTLYRRRGPCCAMRQPARRGKVWYTVSISESAML